jgi:hypothetical protein
MYYLVKFSKDKEVYQTLVPLFKLIEAIDTIVNKNSYKLHSINIVEDFIEFDTYLDVTEKIEDDLEFGGKQ